MGVQLEISRGLRSRLFHSLTIEGREQPSEAFHRFVQAVRDAIEPFKRPSKEWPETLGSEIWT
jgi:collagenase-like PrtC family protease